MENLSCAEVTSGLAFKMGYFNTNYVFKNSLLERNMIDLHILFLRQCCSQDSY